MKLNHIRHIILADDDEDDRSVFTDVMKEIDAGIKIETASHGLRLMEMLKNFAPDILFLDLEMPYKNGLECLVEIRNNPALKKLFIVVFSSTSRPANIQAAYEMGADLFLIKNASFHQYKSALRNILDLNWNEPEAIRNAHYVNNKFVAFQ